MRTQLKFYADTPHATNKLFSFRINGHRDVASSLKRFMSKGFYIRAAWIEDWISGTRTNNRRINLEGYKSMNTKTVILKSST